MRTYPKAEGLWNIIANGYEKPKEKGTLLGAKVKNHEAMCRKYAKAFSKIQMRVSRAIFVTCYM